MPVEKIVTSNEQKDIPEEEYLKKTEVSNNVDYNLDKIDEEKFQEFTKMVDYIKENGWEYGEEYKRIMNDKIKPFEEQIKDILDRNNESWENNNLDSMSDEEIADEADERMKNQPEKLRSQQELIKKINWNWSPEEIQKLNEIINENMADLKSFYDKITSNAYIKKAD